MKLNHHESNPKHPQLQEIECPECFHIKYGEPAMIDHLVYGERWTRDAATAFVQAEIEFLKKGGTHGKRRPR